MDQKIIIEPRKFQLIIKRLCHQLIENHNNFSETVLIGLQPRGIYLLERIKTELEKIGVENIRCGQLDITFFRDDFGRRDKPVIPSVTNIDFIIEGLNVVLIDDVLYTGRTIRSGLDALQTFGRPSKVELLTLIDRKFSRHLPIQPDYVGDEVDSLISDKVEVEWEAIEGEDRVILYTAEKG